MLRSVQVCTNNSLFSSVVYYARCVVCPGCCAVLCGIVHSLLGEEEVQVQGP